MMHIVTSALALSVFTLQDVWGAAGHQAGIVKRDLESFIQSETTVALNGVLCNVGDRGCHAAGVAPGVVIAGTDHISPPYFYSWTRDSALTFKCLVDRFITNFDYDLQNHIHDYIVSGAKIQGIANPAGSLSDGQGLGEAKFNVDLTAFTGAWGRPQRDGPALRAITMMTYGKWLVDNGYKSTASDIIWPVVRNDLNYVAQYWNQTGFDLWEEVEGSSFFTIANQHRALVQGAAFAESMGDSPDNYKSVAPQILCFLQSFWVPSGGYINSNINVDNDRTGKDADSILASIQTFDPSLGCDSTTLQPCSDKMLSNHKALIDSFRFYEINHDIPAGSAIAVGRYAEDVFYSGNSWYLTTLAAAEVIYDAMYVWKQRGSIEVTATSLSFFQDLVKDVKPGFFKSDSSIYRDIYDAASAYADGFVEIVSKYQGPNGVLSEEFSRTNGTALSAHNLTWSYASFLTAVARRAGQVPPSWAGSSATSLPSACKATSVLGSYATATKTSFPASLTPTSGAPPSSTTSCAAATQVAVTFEERVTTQYGQTIKIVGNTQELGNWDPAKAITLDASLYDDSNRVWLKTVNLPAGKSIEYKYLRVDTDGKITWESDPNHRYTVPQTCASMAVRFDTWQS